MSGSPFVPHRDGWCTRTAVVIASGPSLTRADCELVQAARERDTVRVISVSNAWKLTARWADAFFACDRKYWVVYKRAMHDAGVPLERMVSSCNQTAREGVEFVRVANRPGVGRHMLHSGANSGYQAVNLAYLWGARRIVLLGMDMALGAAGERHFDGNHPSNMTQAQPFGEWLKRFEVAAKEYRELDIEVLNATRGGALEAFPRVDLAEVLACR